MASAVNINIMERRRLGNSTGKMPSKESRRKVTTFLETIVMTFLDANHFCIIFEMQKIYGCPVKSASLHLAIHLRLTLVKSNGKNLEETEIL